MLSSSGMFGARALSAAHVARVALLRPSALLMARGLTTAVPPEPKGPRVEIVDVSPRDGLQNEKSPVSAETKLELIRRLEDAGLKKIEVTSFVSPKWVPQMADHTQVYQAVLQSAKPGVSYPVLVPNAKGLEMAKAAAAAVGKPLGEIAVFAASSEGFSQKNTNRSVAETAEQLGDVIRRAVAENIPVRGYLSTVIACPYDGATDPATVALLTEQLLDFGCYQVSLGDTIGVGTPRSTQRMLEAVTRRVPIDKLAIHAHDTYGQGVANVVAAVEMGVRTVDASAGGLGGCPYARGATGNVATEDVAYALAGLGYETGVDLQALAATGAWITSELGRAGSRAGNAINAQRI